MARLETLAGRPYAWASRLALSSVPFMPPSVRRHFLFVVCQHRFGHFRSPRTFSEKVNWRILHDRRDIIALSCDKLWMKERARRLGVRVPKHLWSGVDVAELAAVELPERWVLKANHGSDRVYFGHGQVRDVTSLRAATAGWTANSRPARYGEWAYSKARPLLIVEEMLGDGDASPPDYKFFVFEGKPVLIVMETDRFSGHRRRFYSPSWEPLELQLGQLGAFTHLRPLAAATPKPATLATMLATATVLAEGYEFMRVDLYSIRGEVYAGELTPYPGGGLTRFWPHAFDVELGSHWRLPAV